MEVSKFSYSFSPQIAWHIEWKTFLATFDKINIYFSLSTTVISVLGSSCLQKFNSMCSIWHRESHSSSVNAAHSMRAGRVYVTVGCPSVCPVDNGGRRVCCWAPCRYRSVAVGAVLQVRRRWATSFRETCTGYNGDTCIVPIKHESSLTNSDHTWHCVTCRQLLEVSFISLNVCRSDSELNYALIHTL